MTIRAAIAKGQVDNITEFQTFQTGENPKATMAEIVAWLRERQPFDALGIASFGPIDPRPGSATFGHITTTPKLAWRNFDVYSALNVFDVPVGFDTDVNAPAMYEYEMAKKQAGNEEMSSCAYITVGTGVGIGMVVNGSPVHGMLHPEGGHMPYPSRPGDTFGGLEGHDIREGIEANVSAIALMKRAKLDNPSDLADLPDDHPCWTHAAHYLAGACVNIILLTSAERIVIGGGVMNRLCLFEMIHKMVQEKLNGYLALEQITTDAIKQFIVPGKNGNDTGIIGALALAQMVLKDSEELKSAEPVVDSSETTKALLTGAVLGAAATFALLKLSK